MGAGARRARQIRTECERTGRVPVLGRPGRRRKEASPGVVRRVLRARRKHRAGATAIRAILAIPGLSHHMAHRILEGRGMASRAGRRARRVPWVRYEREYSNSMWHTDWTLLPDGRRPVAHGDGASRFIAGHGMFSSATSASALRVLRKATKGHGKPASVMADHGARSCATGSESRRRGATAFEKFPVAGEMRHVLSGAGHPQTNGKVERFFGEARARLDTFADTGEIVAWWNTAKPHRSLDFRAGETPCEAFEARMPPEGEGVVVDGAAGDACRVHRGPPPGPEGGLLMARRASPHRRGNDFRNPQMPPRGRTAYIARRLARTV